MKYVYVLFEFKQTEFFTSHGGYLLNTTIVKLWVSSVAAIYRLRFLGSVFLCLREDLKGKSGPLRDLCLSLSPLYFLFFSFLLFLKKAGPDGQLCVAFAFIQYLKENFTVRCIIFCLRTDMESKR